MSNQEEQLNALSDIRNMMDRSSRFISLSGLSGVFAGLTALVGAYFAHGELNKYLNGDYGFGIDADAEIEANLIKIAFLVLIVALAGGFIFTYRQSKKKNIPFWGKTAKNLLINLAIPLVVGGLFIIALLFNFPSAVGLIASSCLIFYGLALINASKYTYTDTKPVAGTNYYRLKQIDFNGDFAYSAIATAKVGLGSDNLTVAVAANKSAVTVNYKATVGGKAHFGIYNSTGVKLASVQQTVTAGLNQISIPANLGNSIHILNVSQAGATASIKF